MSRQEQKLNPGHLSEATCAKIDAWLTQYPADQKQSALLYALRLVQEENGNYLTNELMDAVADYLELPRVTAYEAVSFYSMYHLKPTGKYVISVCTNISCMLCGCKRIVEHLNERLGIGFGETTPDGKFTLKAVECLAACGNAPVLQINDKTYYEKLTIERVDTILNQLA